MENIGIKTLVHQYVITKRKYLSSINSNLFLNKDNKSRNIRFFLVSAIISLVIISCNDPSPYPEDAKFQKLVFSDSTFQKISQINPKIVNVFIDVSMSNAGFVSEPNSDFLNSIREICSIVSPDTRIRFYAFGTKLTLVGEKTKASLDYFQNEANYNNSETRFDIVLDKIKSSSDNEINLIFTDGIHSENKATSNTYVELAAQIRKYVREGNLFGLMGKKGIFSGEYYPESIRGSFHYKGLRPYYCFIFGYRCQTDFIKTHIMDEWDNYFLLFPAAISSMKTDFYVNNVGVDESMVKDNTLLLKNDNEVDTFKIPITIRSEDFRFWDLYNIESTMEMKRVNIYYQFEKDSMEIIKDKIITKETNINVVKAEKNDLLLNVNYIPEKNDGMTIYRLRITPKIPNWINEWSSDYDGNYEHVSKTYALKSFTHNLLKITNDNQFTLFSIYFIL